MEEESILLPALDRLYLLIDNHESSNPWLAGRNTHRFEQAFAEKQRMGNLERFWRGRVGQEGALGSVPCEAKEAVGFVHGLPHISEASPR